MGQVNAQSGNHDNPHGAYTQDHQNWNNQAEQMRKRAQLDQDLARMRQEEEYKRQEDSRQRQVQRSQQAQQASKAQKKPQSVNKKPRQGSVQSKAKPQSAPWSNIWALIGMIAGGAFAYPRASGMDEQWWAIGFATVFVGVLAGRFYKVIVFFIGLAVVLGVGAVAINAWAS